MIKIFLKKVALFCWVLIFFCMQISAQATNMEIKDQGLLQKDYASKAYTEMFDAPILTDASAVQQQQEKEYQQSQRQTLLNQLNLGNDESKSTITEQVRERVKNLPLFETNHAAQLDTNEDRPKSNFQVVFTVFIFVALCVLSFFAALFWRQYRKGREQDANYHHTESKR